MEEYLKVTGILKFREIPAEWTEADVAYWWFPKKDKRGRITRPARMSEREKERRTVWEGHNLLTGFGRTAFLVYASSNTASTYVPFAAYFSVGASTIVQVYPSDTAVAGEFFRKQPSSTTITGNQVDIATALLSTDALGGLTNAGLYGGAGVSATLGSGTLYTHSLIIPTFNKASGASYVVDYVLSFN